MPFFFENKTIQVPIHCIVMEKILIAGGSGLIGKKIIELLDKKKYSIYVLSRSARKNTDYIQYYQWDLDKKEIDTAALDVDHIINLAGAGIADKRWSDSRKNLLISSRVESALLLKKGIKESGFRPKSYISASAIGYYGDSGDLVMTEENQPVDQGFLSKCTVAWEDAAKELENEVNRIAIIRIGIVLSKDGGAFQKMLMPFKVGLASYFGDGSMNMSWVHIHDIANLFVYAIQNESIQGIYNGTAPNVVTNKTLIKSIKKNRSGFSILNSVPSLVLRTAMGEMADVVLTSNLVSSSKIADAGFDFKFSSIDPAITNLLEN